MIVSPPTTPALSQLQMCTSFAAMRSRQLSRYVVQGRVRFCTLKQLIAWSKAWARQLPKEVDVIIGLPRSGLIVANTVASELGIPLSTPELFRERQWWNNGRLEPIGTCHRALIIDDSINTGEQMDAVSSELSSKYRDTEFFRGALLPHQKSYRQCDYYYKIVRAPGFSNGTSCTPKNIRPSRSTLTACSAKIVPTKWTVRNAPTRAFSPTPSHSTFRSIRSTT